MSIISIEMGRKTIDLGTKEGNKEFVVNALKYTKQTSDDYLKTTLLYRLPETSVGSYFKEYLDIKSLYNALLRADWLYSEKYSDIDLGKFVFKSHNFKGKEGVLPLETALQRGYEIKTAVFKEGRIEQYIELPFDFVSKSDDLDTTTTWIIISIKDIVTGFKNYETPFVLTVFPGRMINANDTLYGGSVVKIMKV